MVPDETDTRQETLAERALAAWREYQARKEAAAAREEERALALHRQWFSTLLDERLGLAIAPEVVLSNDPTEPVVTVIEDLTFAHGTPQEPADGTLRLVQQCHGCCEAIVYREVSSLVELGELLDTPAECGPCYARHTAPAVPAASRAQPTDQALAGWRQALGDLERALGESTDAARLLRTLQRTERVAMAEHARAVRTALAGQPTSELERVSAFLDRVHGDVQSQAILSDLETQTRRWEQAAADAELARQRCQLAAAVLALHAGRHESEVAR